MSEVQNNVNTYEDEIDLRELIMAVWRNKYVILCIALVLALLAGLYSMLFVSPVYQTRLDIIINMPEQYHTRFGDYTLPISSNDQYINLITSNRVLINTINNMGNDSETLTLDGLRNRISIQSGSSDSGKNTFGVTVSADNPQESLMLAQILFENYIEFVDIMIKERAVEHYYNHYSISLVSLQESLDQNHELLKKNETLLANTPQTINQKEVLEDTQGVFPDSVDFIVLDNVINQNYFDIEKDIIDRKQNIYSLENSISLYSEYLHLLEEERQFIASYYETGDEAQVKPNLIGVVETNIYLPSQPVAPSRKSSPSTTRNAAIGLVIGLMLGVITAYVREFWMKEEAR